MATPNVGGSSNNATGNNTLRVSLIHKIDKCSDRLVDMEIIADRKPAGHSIHEAIIRQMEEIQTLERQLALLK